MAQHIEDVGQGYDLWSTDYDALDNPLVAMTRLALDAWSPSGIRVLEIGCGTGRNAPFFLARGFEGYVGIDLSAGMLAEARRRVTDPRARFLLADGATVQDLGTFDGVFVSLVLEHVPDLRPIVESASRFTTTGGWLRVLELHPTLWAEGTRAHFRKNDVEVSLPSYRHGVEDFQRALAGDWRLARTSDWYADEAASPKLVRHRGKPVLLEIDAVRM